MRLIVSSEQRSMPSVTIAGKHVPGQPASAQAGCREPPDLLGLQKRTGGKVLRVQDYGPYMYNLR